MIRYTKRDGVYLYDVESLSHLSSRHTGQTLALPLRHAELEGWVPYKKITQCLVELSKDDTYSDVAHDVLVAIRKDHKRKREVSRMRRWDIAYRQEYRCPCGELLKPSFEVDHVVPLCEGGQDVEANLRAMCRGCHGQKTRRARQRRSKYFSS